MSETWIGTIAFIEMLILCVGCWFYMLGGRSGKWKRRFVGSLICSTALWVGLVLTQQFNWWALGVYPLLIGAFCLGYGSDVPLTKILKRMIVVAATLTTGVLMAVIIGGNAWMVLPLQAAIAMGSVWLGVKNPITAAAEEFFVCLLLTQCLMMYPFVAVIVG